MRRAIANSDLIERLLYAHLSATEPTPDATSNATTTTTTTSGADGASANDGPSIIADPIPDNSNDGMAEGGVATQEEGEGNERDDADDDVASITDSDVYLSSTPQARLRGMIVSRRLSSSGSMRTGRRASMTLDDDEDNSTAQADDGNDGNGENDRDLASNSDRRAGEAVAPSDDVGDLDDAEWDMTSSSTTLGAPSSSSAASEAGGLARSASSSVAAMIASAMRTSTGRVVALSPAVSASGTSGNGNNSGRKPVRSSPSSATAAAAARTPPRPRDDYRA